MTRFLASLILLLCFASAPAWSEVPPPKSPAPSQPAIADLSLDELFEKLSTTPEGEARLGKPFEAEILKRFNRSGSDTADLLMSWATRAIEEKDYRLALDVLDQITMLRPDYAEGWNKRATVHYLLDDYSSSLADIRQTLALEPRHFGALSGLGIILADTGKEETAIEVYKKALAINPLLGKVRESLERLEKETAGTAI